MACEKKTGSPGEGSINSGRSYALEGIYVLVALSRLNYLWWNRFLIADFSASRVLALIGLTPAFARRKGMSWRRKWSESEEVVCNNRCWWVCCRFPCWCYWINCYWISSASRVGQSSIRGSWRKRCGHESDSRRAYRQARISFCTLITSRR